MPLPEGYLPRKGDVLVVHATVKFDYSPDDDDRKCWVDIEGPFLPLDKIVGIKRRTWKPGERVRLRAANSRDHVFGEVVATKGDYVWLELALNSKRPRGSGDHGLATVHCNEIEPLPGAATVEVHLPDGRVMRPEPWTGGDPDAAANEETRTWESDQGPRPISANPEPDAVFRIRIRETALLVRALPSDLAQIDIATGSGLDDLGGTYGLIRDPAEEPPL